MTTAAEERLRTTPTNLAPSRPGSIQSSTTSAGRKVSSTPSSSDPSGTARTRNPTASRAASRLLRIASSSSTTRTRTGSPMPASLRCPPEDPLKKDRDHGVLEVAFRWAVDGGAVPAPTLPRRYPLHPSPLGVVDLVVLLLVVAAVVGRLRYGGGLLAAVGSGLTVLVVAWLVAVGVATWAPGPAADLAADSSVVRAVPVPHHALDQAGQLLGLDPTGRNHR